MTPPPTGVTPNPVTVPSDSYYASGGTGVVVSGGPMDPSSASGPWFEEVQTMALTYCRTPLGIQNWIDNPTMSLSGASSVYTIINTRLLTGVTARYTARKTYGVYPNPTWQQPQKFTILALSADYLGNSYGDIDASTLGPVGSVVTSQPWRLRRPWLSTDVEVSHAIGSGGFAAWTFAVRHDRCHDILPVLITGGQAAMMNYFDQIVSVEYGGTFLKPTHYNSPSDRQAYQPGAGDYQLPGPYSTSQESWEQVINYINDRGTDITLANLYGDGSDNFPDDPVSSSIGFSEYDIGRHSFL